MRALPLLAITAALFLLSRRASAANADPYAAPSEDGFVTDDGSFLPWDYSDVPLLDIPLFEIIDPVSEYVAMPDADSRLRAFLYMIRRAEHSSTTPDAQTYHTFFGGSRFSDLSDHPVITGEKRGVPLSDEMCRNAGRGSGCVSTAAGAYQLIRPTWDRVRVAGAWGPRLPDFSPASQDEAARRLLMTSGALSRLESGDVEGAIQRAGREWASLPGSTAKQNPKSMQVALSYYQTGLFA